MGDDQSGREVAIRLCIERLREFEYEVYAVSAVERRASVKGLLLAAWELVAPAAPGHTVPPWRVPGLRLTMDQIIDGMADVLRSAEVPAAVIFGDPDRHGPLRQEECAAFGELASRARCVVVVLSRAESSTSWRKSGCTQVRLSDFTADDVLGTLLRSPAMRRRTLDEVKEAAEFVMGDGDTVRPSTAYARLMALEQA